jgi:hypothetical protein
MLSNCPDCDAREPGDPAPFGPLAPLVARMRQAMEDAARVLNACTVCAGEGWPVCAMCVVWEAEGREMVSNPTCRGAQEGARQDTSW